MSKYCPGCDQVKNSAAFRTDRRANDGLSSWCRQCWIDRGKAKRRGKHWEPAVNLKTKTNIPAAEKFTAALELPHDGKPNVTAAVHYLAMAEYCLAKITTGYTVQAAKGSKQEMIHNDLIDSLEEIRRATRRTKMAGFWEQKRKAKK
jgi:hypothetical protein